MGPLASSSLPAADRGEAIAWTRSVFFGSKMEESSPKSRSLSSRVLDGTGSLGDVDWSATLDRGGTVFAATMPVPALPVPALPDPTGFCDIGRCAGVMSSRYSGRAVISGSCNSRLSGANRRRRMALLLAGVFLAGIFVARRFSYQTMAITGANRMKSPSAASGRLSNNTADIIALAIKKATYSPMMRIIFQMVSISKACHFVAVRSRRFSLPELDVASAPEAAIGSVRHRRHGSR